MSRLVPYDPYAAASHKAHCDLVLQCEERLRVARRNLESVAAAAVRVTLSELPADVISIIASHGVRGVMRRLCRRFAALIKHSILRVCVKNIIDISRLPPTYLTKNPAIECCRRITNTRTVGALLGHIRFSCAIFVYTCSCNRTDTIPAHAQAELAHAQTGLAHVQAPLIVSHIIIRKGMAARLVMNCVNISTLTHVSIYDSSQLQCFIQLGKDKRRIMYHIHQSTPVETRPVLVRRNYVISIRVDVKTLLIMLNEFTIRDAEIDVISGDAIAPCTIKTHCYNTLLRITPAAEKQLANVQFVPPLQCCNYIAPCTMWNRIDKPNNILYYAGSLNE